MDASTLLSTSQDIGSSPIGKKDLVRRAICSRIITGIYRKGDNVPSCRDIAGQLLVSKNSAYEAYYDLVGLGILEARNRSGFTANANTVENFLAREMRPFAKGPAGPETSKR